MFTKITDTDRLNKGVTGLPDSPQLTTTELQTKFDELGNLAIDAFNNHIDELAATAAASQIGATVPDNMVANGNVQSIFNAIATNIGALSTLSHSHQNKETLDLIDPNDFSAWNRIATMLANIISVSSSITTADNSIPTSAAVKNYVDNKDFSEAIGNISYPVGSIFETTRAENPRLHFGGTWEQYSYTDGIFKWVRRS